MTPQQQLDAFLAKYTPALARTARSCIRKMRRRMPGAIEMVYDNWNGLVVGFSPTEKVSDAVISLMMCAEHIDLFFLNGKSLPDPQKLLQGNGKRVRHIKMYGASDLEVAAVQELIAHAIDRSAKPFAGPRKLIIKSISPKQRPRRR